VRRHAEEIVAFAAAGYARTVARAQRAAEAARQVEARQAKLREEVAQATALAAEAAKLVAAQAMAGAREQEHRMAIEAAMAMKVEQGKELAKQQVAKAAANELYYEERLLTATREEIARLMAELVHTRQVAQLTADLEAGRVAAQSKTVEKDARKEKKTKAT
jgi:hypothetical protein